MTQPSKCPACHKEFKNLKAHLRRKTPCIKEEKEIDDLTTSLEKLSIQKYQKPLLKWVGGKTQLLDSIVPLIPQSIENYYEPFVGGGSVLFAVLTLVNEGKIKINNTINAYDSNAKLIEFYTSVQQHPQELYDTIRVLSDTYNRINTLNGKITSSGIRMYCILPSGNITISKFPCPARNIPCYIGCIEAYLFTHT